VIATAQRGRFLLFRAGKRSVQRRRDRLAVAGDAPYQHGAGLRQRLDLDPRAEPQVGIDKERRSIGRIEGNVAGEPCAADDKTPLLAGALMPLRGDGAGQRGAKGNAPSSRA